MQPLQYTVTAEDVKRGLIQLPELVSYEIPAETELLANYPNPFNPETWIPYRLAEDTVVTLTIYDRNGQVVRAIDVGHQTAAVYENRSKAIYWDGRNQVGEHGRKRCLLLSPVRRRIFCHAEDGNSQIVSEMAGMLIFIEKPFRSKPQTFMFGAVGAKPIQTALALFF